MHIGTNATARRCARERTETLQERAVWLYIEWFVGRKGVMGADGKRLVEPVVVDGVH